MLRRVLWLIPTLFVASVFTFWFLARTLPTPERATTDALASEQARLPIFFNAQPTNARDLAVSLMKQVADGGSSGRRAAAQLATLGGAALPHILPRLDELDPKGRARVSMALEPVARRMGIGTDMDLGDPESASLFWTRFWQDREFDFRPIVVRRLVKQLAQRSLALRRDDVVQLDTFALPELVRALGRVNHSEDVERVSRLSTLMAHITGKSWQLSPGSSVRAARSNVQAWQSWWLNHGDSYVTLDGLAKATATVSQTRYGKWLRSIPLGLGVQHNGSSVLFTLSQRFLPTLLLLVSGTLGGYLMGAVGAVRSQLRPSRRIPLWPPAALTLLMTPTALYAPALAPHNETLALLLGCLIMLLLGASTAYVYQRAGARIHSAAPWWPRGHMPRGMTIGVLRACSETTLGLLATGLPHLLLAAAVIEHAFSLRGLASTSVLAVKHADIAWLMAIALLGVVTAAMLQMLSDGLAASHERRPASASLATLPRRG